RYAARPVASSGPAPRTVELGTAPGGGPLPGNSHDQVTDQCPARGGDRDSQALVTTGHWSRVRRPLLRADQYTDQGSIGERAFRGARAVLERAYAAEPAVRSRSLHAMAKLPAKSKEPTRTMTVTADCTKSPSSNRFKEIA